MDEGFWLRDEYDLESLTLAYAYVQDHFTDILDRARRKPAPTDLLPGPARFAPYDIWRAVGNALRGDATSTNVPASVPRKRIDGVKARLTRCMSASPRQPCEARVAALVDDMCSEGDAEPAAYLDVISPVAWTAARFPVSDLLLVRAYTTALYPELWRALIRGSLSRFLIATAEHEKNLIDLEVDMCSTIERAVQHGDDIADLKTASTPDRLLHTIEIIERRVSMLPLTAELGITLPENGDAIEVIERMVSQAKHNCAARAEAAADQHPKGAG